MNMKKMIGALTAKFAVALMAFGCITGGAWAATITVGSSGADYTTLTAAFEAAGDGDTVQLIEDMSFTTTKGLPTKYVKTDGLLVDGKKVTFDLNGHNVTCTRSASPFGAMFYLKNGAELVIDGSGTIVLTPITESHSIFPCVYTMGNTGLKATLGANVTVYAECFGNVEYSASNAETGSTFDIYGTIIGNNNSYLNNLFSCPSGVTNFTVNVLGGTLEIPKYSDMHVNIQASTETTFTFNMTSGKIYCTQANFNAVKFNLFAAVKSTFNITGGYFGSNIPKQGTDPTLGFTLPDGYGFYPVSGVANCPYQVGVCEAKIGNVCYPSVSAAIEAATASNFVALNVDYSDVVTIPAGKTVNFNGGSYTFSGSFTVNGTLRIVGGTYTFNPAAALLGPGCSVTDNGDGTWTVIQSVAQVGETAYSTFADALAAANALGTATIKFLADVDLGSSSINIAAGKNITLDLNGNNLTCSASNQFLVKSGATLILCDTSDGASGTLTHSGQYDLSDNSGTVEILSGTYNVVNYGVAYNNGSAVLNIKGGTVNSAKRAYYKGVTTISGGTINGTISDVATTVITGGVFNNDPTAYVDVENYQVLTNTPSEGYWTVGAPQPVAQIGETTYATLEAAIDAAQDGATIEILDGTWGAAEIGNIGKLANRAKSLTIQAASGASPKFTNTILSLGYDDSSTTRNAAITVKGLAFENTMLLIGNYPQVTVEDCSFVGSNGNSSSAGALAIIESCASNYNRDEFILDQVTVRNCTFDGTDSERPAIRVRDSGNVLITGNTIANSIHNGILLESDTTHNKVNTQVSKTVVIQNNMITEWNAGNVNDGGRGIRADLGEMAAGSTVTISGNKFRKATTGLDTPDFAKITGVGSGTVDLSGNDWNDMLLSEVRGNSTVYFCNVTPTLASVVTTRKEPVAQIGANKYESLRAAIEAVPTTGVATTITMIDDSAETALITVAATQNVVLDLNGKTVSYTTDAKSVYFLTNKGTLKVKDTSTNADGQILLTAQPDKGYSKETVTIYNLGGTLTLESGTIKNATGGGLAYAVNNSSNAWGVGDDKVSTFNMTGGTVSAPSGDAALRVYQNCAAHVAPVSKNYVNISGGTIVDTGIFVDTVLYTDSGIQEGFADSIDTQINISGGTVNGLVDLKIRHKNNTKLNITGGDFTNAKLWVRKVASEYKGDEPTEPMVSISGGQFAFVTGKAFGLSYDCGATSWTSYAKPYEVTGGVFNVNLNSYTGIAFEEGKTGVENTDPETVTTYPYTVGVAVVPVAQIGETKYATLAAAIDDAQGGDTILLLADATLDAAVTVSMSLTITLDGHSITGTITAGTGYELVTSDTAYVVRGAGYAGEVLPAGPDMSGDVINVTAANAQYTLDGAYGDITGKTINFTENITERLDLGRCTKYAGSGTTTSGTYPNHTRTLSNVTFTSSEGVTIAGFTADSGHVCTDGSYDYVRDQAVTSTNNGYYKYSSLTGIRFEGLTVSDNIFVIYGLEGTTCGGITFDGCTFTGNTSDTAPINFNNNGSFQYGDITIQNCTINGSKAGIYINGGAAEYTIKNNYVVAGNNNAIQLWAVVGSAATVDIEGNFLKSDKYTVNLYRFESEQITLTGNAVVAGARGHLGHFQGDASGNFWAPQGATPDASGNMTSTLTEPIADTGAGPGENDITSSSYYSTAVVDTSAVRWVTLSNLHTFVAQIGDDKYETFADAIAAAGENDEIIVLDDTATVPAGWKIAEGKLVPVVYVAQIGSTNGATTNKYSSLAAAIDAAQNGDTIELLCDIELSGTETVEINKVGTYTIDGDGHSITPADSTEFAYHRFLFGMSGDAYTYTKNYTLKNVTISGFTDSAYLVRAEGCALTLKDCTLENNNLPYYTTTGANAPQGSRVVLTTDADLTIDGCTIRNNTTTFQTVDFNTNGQANKTGGTLDIVSSLFSGNSSTGSGVIYSYGSSSGGDKIRNSTFSGNTVNSGAAAVIYFSGATDVTGCFFTNNTVEATVSSQKCGVLALGSKAAGSAYEGNAFVGNTLTSTGTKATVFVGAENIDLGGNYWGSGIPPTTGAGADIYLGTTEGVVYDSFAYSYTLNADNYGVTVVLGKMVAFTGVAPEGVTISEMPTNGAYAVGAALPLPTYEADSATFSGWEYMNKTNFVLTADVPSSVTFVATWKVAKTISVITDDSKPEETTPIKVAEDWIAQNVTNEVGQAITDTEQIASALNETADNGLKVWENYVIGQDPSTAVAVGAEQGAEITAMPVSNTLSVQPVDTGFTVEYSLKQVDTNGTEIATVETKPTTDFDIDLSTVESNAYYVMTATIKTDDGATVSTVTSTNVIGVMKVESGATTTAVAVPWASYDGTNDISVADIVRTANLTKGDSLKAYDPDSKTYKEWTLGADKTWQPSSTYSTSGKTSGNESAGNADAYTVARGSAVWLKRADPSQPIYLVGGATSAEVETKLEAAPSETKSSWNLVGNPTVEPVDVTTLLGDKTGDKVIIPTAGAPKNYEKVDGHWGYWTTQKVEIDGVVVGVESVFKTDDTYVPAGTGFWYLNSSTSEGATINW